MVAMPGGELAGMIEPVLGSMGYELVDIEFGAGGLLRVVIDIAGGSRSVQLEDCEKVSHQLGRLFTVEDVDYARLEISSPGLDRPLRKQADFERFAGEKVSVRMRQPVEGRRQFTGILEREEMADGAGADTQPRWVLHWSDDPSNAANAPAKSRGGRGKASAKGGRSPRAGKGAKKSGEKAGAAGASEGPDALVGAGGTRGGRLEFTLDQIEKARLVPKLAF
jgi:ribosome maturation factor RimP